MSLRRILTFWLTLSVVTVLPQSAMAQQSDNQWVTEEARTPAGYALCRMTRTNADGDALALHVLPGRKVSMDFVDADVENAQRLTNVAADFSVSASPEVVTRDLQAFSMGQRGLKFLFPVEDNEIEGLFTALSVSESATFAWRNPLGGSALGEFTIQLGGTEAAMDWLAGCIQRAPAVSESE